MLSSSTAIIGVIMSAQPGFIFGNVGLHVNPPSNWTSRCAKQYNDTCVGCDTKSTYREDMSWLGYLLLVGATITYIVYVHATTRIIKDVKSDVLIFWVGWISFIASICIAFIIETPHIPSNMICVGLVIGHSVMASQVMFCTSYVTIYMSVNIYFLICCLTMPVMLLLQYTWLQDVNPGLGNWVEVLGGVYCFIGSISGPIANVMDNL